MIKLFRYKKKATAIFVEVKHLVQYLPGAVTEQKTIWNSITLVVALDSLHNDFEMTIAPLFHLDNKDLEEIQLIVTSIKVANTSRCDFNLISPSQLREAGILYYDYPENMILKKAGNIIDSV